MVLIYKHTRRFHTFLTEVEVSQLFFLSYPLNKEPLRNTPRVLEFMLAIPSASFGSEGSQSTPSPRRRAKKLEPLNKCANMEPTSGFPSSLLIWRKQERRAGTPKL